MHATTVAIDLAKDVFELAYADTAHQIVERKRLSRRTLARALDNRWPVRVVMEACGSAHYWARRFAAQGHTVRMLPARDVRLKSLRPIGFRIADSMMARANTRSPLGRIHDGNRFIHPCQRRCANRSLAEEVHPRIARRSIGVHRNVCQVSV